MFIFNLIDHSIYVNFIGALQFVTPLAMKHINSSFTKCMQSYYAQEFVCVELEHLRQN